MHQYLGLILLILAVAAAVYVFSHSEELLQFTLPVPSFIKPVGSFPSDVAEPVHETPAPKKIIEEPAPVLEPKPESTKSKVQISSIKWVTSYHPFMEVVLRSDLEKGKTANITGWTIKSNYSSFGIPQAQEIYEFGGPQQDIILKYYDAVHFYSGRGPKGNLRLNKCLGYIEDVTPFTPPVPKRCPRISRSEINYLGGYCQDYLLSLKTCQNPSSNPPVPLDDWACHDYLSKLNYVGCVEKYQNDADFLLKEWWVWLDDKINIFDPVHDKAQLLDKEGKVVDEYKY